jgi:hypothetical protein
MNELQTIRLAYAFNKYWAGMIPFSEVQKVKAEITEANKP